MRHIPLFVCFCIMSTSLFGQITYKKGHYIDNDGQRVDGLIRDEGWNYNPDEIQFRVQPSSAVRGIGIDQMREFGIGEDILFARYEIAVDKSSDDPQLLDNSAQPKWDTVTAMLKLLVKGQVNLFVYRDMQVLRYFFSEDISQTPQQLVFKQYLQGNRILTNYGYRSQLLELFDSEIIGFQQVQTLDYEEGALVALFKKYNSEFGKSHVYSGEPNSGSLIHLTLRPGVFMYTLGIRNLSAHTLDAEFEDDISFRIGIEAEYVFGFRNGTWAIFAEPTFSNIARSGNTIGGQSVTVDYKTVSVPLGVRHYVFLKDRTRLFANIAVVSRIDLNGIVDFETAKDLDAALASNLAIGLGVKQGDRLSVELRYDTNSDFLGRYYVSYRTLHKRIALIAGITLF